MVEGESFGKPSRRAAKHRRFWLDKTMMNKVETIAILLNGGVSESDFLKLPNVRRKDIDEAKELIETGFDYVTDIDDMKLFRKRKCGYLITEKRGE